MRAKLIKFLWKPYYSLFSFAGFIYREFAYKNIYFVDTNFLIKKNGEKDSRFIKVNLNSKKVFITNYIESEVNDLCSRNEFTRIKPQEVEIISFDTLYLQRPGICPVYHNFIGAMHNPAQITSSDFLLQMFFAKITKGKTLTAEEQKLYSGIIAGFAEESRRKRFRNGKKKDPLSVALQEAHLKSIRKRVKGLKGKNDNYPNDIRNLALVFTYALLNKRNITFLTTDSDSISYFFDWFFTLVQQVTFKQNCLLELSKNDQQGMKDLLRGRKIAQFFDSQWMCREVDGTTQKFLSNNKKYFSPRLTIKYWDKSKQRFFKVGVNIDRYIRELFLHEHGNLNCPTAKNDIYGAFMSLIYWWPPTSEKNINIFKILPIRKPLHRQARFMLPVIHDQACRYRRNDLSGQYGSFSSFKIGN